MPAAPPSRPTGRLVINFGVVPVPVQVFTGVEEVSVSRSMRTPAGNPVKFVTADAVTGEIVPRSETSLVYVSASGAEVPLSDEEIAEALGQADGSCDLVGFYPLPRLAAYAPASVMQVRPQTVRSGKSETRPFDAPFVLMMRAMEEAGVFGLVRFTLRGRPRLAALRPDGTLTVLYWGDEVRAARPMPDAEVSEAQAGLAARLVAAMTGDEPPVIGSPVAAVLEYAEAKARGAAPAAPAQEAPAVVDLMAALQASLSAVAA